MRAYIHVEDSVAESRGVLLAMAFIRFLQLLLNSGFKCGSVVELWAGIEQDHRTYESGSLLSDLDRIIDRV